MVTKSHNLRIKVTHPWHADAVG